MSKETTSQKAVDTNYIKLGQIYHILKENTVNAFYNDKIMDIDVSMNNFINANYKLPSDSLICRKYPHYSGNTVSHLIVRLDKDPSYFFEQFIERDIGLDIQNDNGYTPLLLAFIKGIKIDYILSNYIKRKILNNFHSKNGLSHFHVACTTSMTEIIDHYLKNNISVNERVNDDSPKFGGYTPLHFAMEYCQPQTIELLLKNGANLNSKNANGLTPLHLLIKKLLLNKVSKDNKVQKFFQEAVSNNLFDLPDDVGFTLTHLKSILGTFENEEEITNIDSSINLDSPFFPGFTPLHFADLNFQTVTLLLKAGANLLAKDIYGTTPLDLCLRKFNKDQIIELLLVEKRHQLSKLKFTNGVEIIEALKAMQKNDEFENYIKQKFVDINDIIPLESPIWPGCSLLHLVVIFDGPVDKILACPNINLEIQDAKGMSPLHIAFSMKRAEIVEKILNSLTFTTSYPVDQNNLSYLHVACAVKNVKAVKLLLEKGADPNLSTLCDFQWELTDDCNVIKAGSTPLHIAVYQECEEDFDFVNVLMEYGAKPNLEDANGITPYHIALMYHNEIIFDKMLKSDKEFDSRKEYEKLGLTRLQIACFIHDLSMVEQELESGAEVNKQISFDSKIWPGDTALHILCRKPFESRNEFVQLLLAYEADPCLQNAKNSTPVHLSIGKIFQISSHLLGDNFFSKNPVNNQGRSHFHMACIANNLLAVENYLKSGTDVNEAVDYYADLYAGFTPLHLAVWNDSVELIELLFNYGADHNIISSEGFTPLHLAVSARRQDSLRKLLSYPIVDIQAKNIFGDTALVMNFHPLFFCKDNVTEILVDKGAYLNFDNLFKGRHSYLSIFQIMQKIRDNEVFRKLIANVPDLTKTDDEGNNLIHHIASANCIDEYFFWNVYEKIEILVDHGCEFDHKNNGGKTPLHLAASSDNYFMCEALLGIGADINIKDDDKKTPYFYVSHTRCRIVFIQHLMKLEEVGFYIDYSNKLYSDDIDFYDSIDDYSRDDEDYRRPFIDEDHSRIPKEKKELESWLKKEINPTFLVAYIFSNQFLKDFKSIPESQRQKMLDYCEYKDISLRNRRNRSSILRILIKVQFRRARMKNRLLVPAANSFQELAGLVIPEMCLEVVNHLDIDSLMNLIRAVNGKLEFAPLIENN